MIVSGARPSLGQVIRARRIALGMSQEALAARVSDLGSEINQADISRIELGKVDLPRRRRLEHLAAALELSLGELLEASGWVGAGERFGADATMMMKPGTAPVATAKPSVDGSYREVDSSHTTIDAIVRLRTAVTRAHEPIARAAQLIEECHHIAQRWDASVSRAQAALSQPGSGRMDSP